MGPVFVSLCDRYLMTPEREALLARIRSPRSHVGNVGEQVRDASRPAIAASCAITSSHDVEQAWRSRGEAAIREEMDRRLAAWRQLRKGRR